MVILVTLPRAWGIYNVFDISLLEPDQMTTLREAVDSA
jgi:hypothetical protein